MMISAGRWDHVMGIPPSLTIPLKMGWQRRDGWQPSQPSRQGLAITGCTGWQETVGMATGQGNKYMERVVSYSTLVVVNSHKFISYPDWYLVIHRQIELDCYF